MPKTKAAAPAASKEKPIGAVTHFYGGLNVAIVKFSKPIKAGTTVRFEGHTTNFTQALTSMQYDHKEIDTAPKGKEVGVKVDGKVRDGDKVFLVE